MIMFLDIKRLDHTCRPKFPWGFPFLLLFLFGSCGAAAEYAFISARSFRLRKGHMTDTDGLLLQQKGQAPLCTVGGTAFEQIRVLDGKTNAPICLFFPF